MKNRLKTTILTTALTLCSTVAFADNHESKQGSFDERKARIVNKMDNHLDKMKQARDCVSASQNEDQMKECRPKKGEHSHRHGDRSKSEDSKAQ